MKKTFLLLALAVCFAACSPSPVEKALKQYVLANMPSNAIEYQLIDYQLVDTLYVSQVIDSLIQQLPFFSAEYQQFIQNKNKVIELSQNTIEYNFELAKTNKKADSLIAQWNDFSPYTYEYNYLYCWYTRRLKELQGADDDLRLQMDAMMQYVEDNEPDFRLLSQLINLPLNDICFYVLSHTFSFHVMGKQVAKTDIVFFDNQMNMIRSLNQTDYIGVAQQILD